MLTVTQPITFGNEGAANFSVAVSASSGTPTGTVTVSNSGGTLCTITLSNGAGHCGLSATQVPAGSYTDVVASYLPSGAFTGSSSAASLLTVAKDTTTTKVSEVPVTVTQGQESASVFTVSVGTHYGEAIPSGETVSVLVGSTSCVAVPSGGSGTCHLSNSALTAGSYPVSATYGGDGSLAGSSGSSGSNLTVDASTVTPPVPPPSPALGEGAYVGPANPTGLATFASTTGTKPSIASDYLPANSGWSGMDGAYGSLTWLLANGWHGTGYTLSLGVPMIPTDASNTPVGTLAAGATGAYNSYFVTLAQTLIAGGEANADLRLGWEFDGNWYAWEALTPSQEASYAAYFDQIVTAMRSVPGQAFTFAWNPDASAFIAPGYNVAAAYPGNAYVDYVGIDVYDQSWISPLTPTNVWSTTTLPALTAAQHFAAAHGKPVAVCEWGVAIRPDGHGLGDDPLYMNNMLSWMLTAANNVAFESYFDYNTLPVGGDTNAALTGGSFPQSLAAFIAKLG